VLPPIKAGQAYVTSIITAIMSRRTLWQTTAILLSWDDWSGFYDHVPPGKTSSGKSYGLRVSPARTRTPATSGP
jgi:phospholipase C